MKGEVKLKRSKESDKRELCQDHIPCRCTCFLCLPVPIHSNPMRHGQDLSCAPLRPRTWPWSNSNPGP